MPQILVGSDRAILFPRPVLDKNGQPVEIATARLLQSTVSGKFIAHGFAQPDQSIELSDNDISENQVVVGTGVDTNVPVDSVVPMNSRQRNQGQTDEVQLDDDDITDSIQTITTDDERDDHITERVMCHSPKMCNASVVFNRL